MIFYDILDNERKKILPLFSSFKNDFYLAGGTALALQFGHRDSIDFDFFCEKNLDTQALYSKLKEIFIDYQILKIQEEKNTLTILVDENIKISFFTYKYKLLNQLISQENFNLASVEDIACMKLSAIVGRAMQKDYIDLYFILQNISLERLLFLVQKKFADLDQNLVLKSLVYFDDVAEEEIIFKHNNNITFALVKKFLLEIVRSYKIKN